MVINTDIKSKLYCGQSDGGNVNFVHKNITKKSETSCSLDGYIYDK